MYFCIFNSWFFTNYDKTSSVSSLKNLDYFSLKPTKVDNFDVKSNFKTTFALLFPESVT